MTTRPSILLIEDSPGECELFRAAVKETRVAVSLQIESTVEAAFRFLAKADGSRPLPSLILLDLKLGKQHGLDVLRELRGDTRVRHVPVIVFTTSDHPADLAACYAAGANGYVTKPDTYEALLHFIMDLHNYWLRWNRSVPPVEIQC
ncbi:MAG: response regulator [Nitrospiraceae bacterium]